jgi:hypothetical protein
MFTLYLLTAIGLTPGGRSAEHIYTQTIHRTTQQHEEHNNGTTELTKNNTINNTNNTTTEKQN